MFGLSGARARGWVAAVLLGIGLAGPVVAQSSPQDQLAAALRAGAYDEARAILDAADASLVDRLYVEGLIALRRDAPERAVLFLRRAVDLSPETATIRRALIEALARTDAIDTAIFQAELGATLAEDAETQAGFRRVADALRARRPFGFSFGVAAVPSSNFNRATENTTVPGLGGIDSGTIDETGRTGLGVRVRLGTFWRAELSDQWEVRVDGYGVVTAFTDPDSNRKVFGSGLTLTRGFERVDVDLRFDLARALFREASDNSTLGAVTLAARAPFDRLRTRVGLRYAERAYDDGVTASVFNYSEIDAFGSVARAVRPDLAVRAQLRGRTRDAVDDRFSFVGLRGEVGLTRSWATGWTVSGDVYFEQNWYDEVFGGAFPEARSDQIWGVRAAVRTNRLTLWGAAPEVSCEISRTRSNIVFYDDLDVEECALALTRRF
ncbi:MAG: surface lipoprotein assembly modifier [Pseudomonadota bacterium]